MNIVPSTQRDTLHRDVVPNRFEVRDFGVGDVEALSTWLCRTDLGPHLSLVFEGSLFFFGGREERVAFALGLRKGVALLSQEPVVHLTDDELYGPSVVLTTGSDAKPLRALAELFLKELHLARWVDHEDDFWVHSSHVSQLLMRKPAWDALSLNQRRSILDRAQGFQDHENI